MEFEHELLKMEQECDRDPRDNTIIVNKKTREKFCARCFHADDTVDHALFCDYWSEPVDWPEPAVKIDMSSYYKERLHKEEQEHGYHRDPADDKVLIDKKGQKRCARCYHDGSVSHASFCDYWAWERKIHPPPAEKPETSAMNIDTESTPAKHTFGMGKEKDDRKCERCGKPAGGYMFSTVYDFCSQSCCDDFVEKLKEKKTKTEKKEDKKPKEKKEEHAAGAWTVTFTHMVDDPKRPEGWTTGPFLFQKEYNAKSFLQSKLLDYCDEYFQENYQDSGRDEHGYADIDNPRVLYDLWKDWKKPNGSDNDSDRDDDEEEVTELFQLFLDNLNPITLPSLEVLEEIAGKIGKQVEYIIDSTYKWELKFEKFMDAKWMAGQTRITDHFKSASGSASTSKSS